jgi:hypothetical protein|tara:strand:+ start:3029 stop:4552 length:1524 start_codon:yes stop_codon:yes gene_type:complete
MEEQLMIDQPFITDPDVIAQFNELGIDPTGKTADQLNAEIETLMIKKGATTFFDPKDPLDYLTLGLGLTGIGTGAAVGIKGLRTAKKTAEAATLMQKAKKLKDLLNPFYRRGPTPGPTVTPLSPPGPAYSTLINPTIPIGIKTPQGLIYSAGGIKAADEALEETRLADQAALIQDDINALKIEEIGIADQVIEDVQKNLEAQKSEDSKAADVAASSLEKPTDKVTEQTDRPSISDIFGTPQFDRFIRNVGAKLVETGQVGAGLAQGAAAAAEERAAEELALQLKLIEAGKKEGITANKLSEIRLEYQNTASEFSKTAGTEKLLFDVIDIINKGNVTGLPALVEQIKYRFGAFFNYDQNVPPVITAANILEEIAKAKPKDAIGQEGKLSDQDIIMAQQIMGAIKNADGSFKTNQEVEDILRRRLSEIGTDQINKLNKINELEYQIRRAGDIPPVIITDFSSGSGVTPESTNQDEINIKLQPEEDDTVTTDENKKYSFGSGGVYVPQSG